MRVRMGPVLRFSGCQTDRELWKLSALIVVDAEPGSLRYGSISTDKEAFPVLLWRQGGMAAYRYELVAELQPLPSTLTYSIDGNEHYTVHLPAAGYPPQMAYASCNGFSTLKAMKGVRDKNHLWKRMRQKHDVSPYHLLLLGGDQVYADSMWETLPSMAAWNQLPFDEANAAPFSPEMETHLRKFYFDLYVDRWALPEVAQILARVPSIMMWDDHDIIDGWGSYLPERQASAVFQGMWRSARKAFAVFQQHTAGDPHPNGLSPIHGFSFAYQIGRIAILSLDMRSERTIKQVISPEHCSKIYSWMDSLKDVDHLIILSSIPVVYPGFDTIERVLGWMPGQTEYDDDLRDHWNSRPHKGERLRLIHRLLDLARKRNILPTLISGDVHVAAVGQIEATHRSVPLIINQLISSAIVHPGPPGVMVLALTYLFKNEDEIDAGIRARMTEFPGIPDKFIGKRNFLSLEPDSRSVGARYWANWIVEGEDDPYTKVIVPVSESKVDAIAAE